MEDDFFTELEKFYIENSKLIEKTIKNIYEEYFTETFPLFKTLKKKN